MDLAGSQLFMRLLNGGVIADLALQVTVKTPQGSASSEESPQDQHQDFHSLTEE